MSAPAPYFSVVTPSYHQARWLEGCIKSVLGQGVADFEHLIFDNASSDGSAEIAARYPHLVWHSEPDRGQSHALNKALALARGEIVCWLNADDQYLPGAFEIVRRAFATPDVGVVFGDAQEVFFDGRPGGIRRARFDRREDLLLWWEKRTDLLQPAVFFRRSVFEEAGPFREDLHLIMDTEMWWRMSERHQFHFLCEPLALQQRQPDSKTIRQVERIYEEKARVFGPLLATAWPRRRFLHWLERHCAMSRRFLGFAQSTGNTDRSVALHFLRRSAAENPLILLTVCWWKAALFILCGGGRNRRPDPPVAARGETV
jgi:glycosyltransferase involved in cell wall biosynthesis